MNTASLPLYISVENLVSFGISKDTVWNACARNRQGITQSWANIPDPADRRRVLIAYDSIPAATRAKLPTKQELLQRLSDAAGAADREAQAQRIREILPLTPDRDLAALRAFRIARETTDLRTGEVSSRQLSGLPEAKIREYARACRWLALLSDPRWKQKGHRTRLSADFGSYHDFQQAVLAVLVADGVALPTNYSKLMAKLRAYEQHGAPALVSKAYGNPNAQKVDEQVLDYLTHAYSDARKPPLELVHRWYLNEVTARAVAGLEAWPEISLGTVKNALMKPDVMPVWYLARHGFKAWKEKYEYTMLCHRPSARDVQWVIDGTKVNKRYVKQGPKGKQVSALLKVVAVVDVATEYILGWALAETEDAALVAQAVRVAVRRSGGVVPMQFLYDNDSANVAFFKDRWPGFHYPAMPNNGQSKTVEGIFKRLQTQVMRADSNFTGQNITAHALDSRQNPELLVVKELPTLAECIELATLELHQWNNKPGRDGRSPKQRYEASQNPEAARLTEADEVAAFWEWQRGSSQYRRDGLRVTLGGQQYQYEALDAHGQPDGAFHSRYVGQEFGVKLDPADPDRGAAVYVGAGAEARFVTFLGVKEAMPRALADYQADSRQKINQRLGLKKDQHAQAAGQHADITERLDAEDQLKLVLGGRTWLGKDVEAAAEADYLAELVAVGGPAPRPAAPAPPLPPLRTADAASQAVRDYYLNLQFEDD